ncbi:MAG: hypothetical protein AAFR59_15225, partial [Bacteroidota bacterium]
RRLKQNGEALFVLVNRFSDLNNVKEGFQKRLAESLRHEGAHGISQWQEIASKIALTSLEILKPESRALSTETLISQFTNKSVSKVGSWIQKLSDTFCRANDFEDPEIIKAILWSLSEGQQPYVVNWLGGEELAQYKSNELRLPSQGKSFDTTLRILEVISYFYELVVCFDELDYEDFNDQGLHRSQVVAGLIREVFENLRRGLILTSMMPGTWNGRVKQLAEGICCRLTAQGKPYNLNYIDESSIIDLATFYLGRFYASKNIQPPHSLYPFDESQLKLVGREKPTVREALKWCKENCNPLAAIPEKGSDSAVHVPETPDGNGKQLNEVEEAFCAELQEDSQAYWEDNHWIGDALLFSFQQSIGQIIEGVEVLSVSKEVRVRGGKDPYLNFKVIGKDSDSEVCIGVAVLQHDGGRGLGAGFRRLLDENNDFGLTRGCLVRSYEKPLNSYFR